MSDGNKNIRLIIFDLGGVVVPEKSDWINSDIAEKLGVPLKEFMEIKNAFLSQLQTGKITLRDFYFSAMEACSKHFNKTYTVTADDMVKFHIQKYIEYGNADNVSPFKPVYMRIYNLLRGLHLNYRVVCLTNTELEIAEYNKNHLLADHLTLFEEFKDAYLSTDLKMRKPSPSIYKYVLNKEVVAPQEAIFIDDNPEYVEAARKLGIHAVLYKNVDQLIVELRALGIRIS